MIFFFLFFYVNWLNFLYLIYILYVIFYIAYYFCIFYCIFYTLNVVLVWLDVVSAHTTSKKINWSARNVFLSALIKSIEWQINNSLIWIFILLFRSKFSRAKWELNRKEKIDDWIMTLRDNLEILILISLTTYTLITSKIDSEEKCKQKMSETAAGYVTARSLRALRSSCNISARNC